MRIGIVEYVSPKTDYLSKFFLEINERLELEFKKNNIDNCLKAIYIGFYLNEFELKNNLISKYKYYKNDDFVDFMICPNVPKYFNNNFEQFLSNFFEDFKLGIKEVFEKKFKNKKLGILIIALAEKALLGSASQNIDVLLEELLNNNSKVVKESKNIEYKELEEDVFWNTIETFFLQTDTFEKNITTIENKLSKKDDIFIIGFNLTLRRMIDSLAIEGIINQAQKVNGYVSDDSFIYLRCKLITFGRALYHKLISCSDLDALSSYFKFDDGEGLLYVADNAINIKHKDSYNSDLPSYVADKVFGAIL